VTKEDIRKPEMGAAGEPVESEAATLKGTTRREFLKTAGVGGASLALFATAGVTAATSSEPAFVENAKTMIVHRSNRCVGCRRCEIACSLYHDSKICLATSRVKISRNHNFGPAGASSGVMRGGGQGLFGDFRLIGETCLQCAHPVPCATACPQGAIEVSSKTGARVINQSKCIGCGTCVKACPWGMTTLDKETNKVQKCDLCNGSPQCVKICPAGALVELPWRDRSTEVSPRQSVPAWVGSAGGVAESTCAPCHKVTL